MCYDSSFTNRMMLMNFSHSEFTDEDIIKFCDGIRKYEEKEIETIK